MMHNNNRDVSVLPQCMYETVVLNLKTRSVYLAPWKTNYMIGVRIVCLDLIVQSDACYEREQMSELL